MRKLAVKKLSFIDNIDSADIDWDQLELLYASVKAKRPFHRADRLRLSYINSYSFCIAIYEGDLIGCGRTISDGQVHGWIHDVFVRADFQKHGIGTMILGKLVEQLKGVRYLGLLCASENIKFYEKSGFQPGCSAMIMRQKTR